MDKFIVTISREFGSGGRLIGEELAKRLGVPFYDKAIIQMAAEKSGLSYDFIENTEEKSSGAPIYNIPMTATFAGYTAMGYIDTPVNDKTFLAQAEVIRDVAKSSCVIVGRCADYILRDEPGLVRVFISGKLEDRIARAVKLYNFPEAGALEKIRKIDKSRANYYRYYTDQNWGSVHNYDITLNTSFTDIDGAVDVLLTLLKNKGVAPQNS